MTPLHPWLLWAGIGNSFALETAPMGFGVELLNPFGLAAAIGQTLRTSPRKEMQFKLNYVELCWAQVQHSPAEWSKAFEHCALCNWFHIFWRCETLINIAIECNTHVAGVGVGMTWRNRHTVLAAQVRWQSMGSSSIMISRLKIARCTLRKLDTTTVPLFRVFLLLKTWIALDTHVLLLSRLQDVAGLFDTLIIALTNKCIHIMLQLQASLVVASSWLGFFLHWGAVCLDDRKSRLAPRSHRCLQCVYI